jgi:ABC-2 type transport system permease protein
MGGSLLTARKDLTVLFRSPLAYLILAAFLFISGYFFVSAMRYFELISMQIMQSPQAPDVTPVDLIVAPYLRNAGVILLFLLPLLTMRGFAEEKRMGTFELLMGYPLGEAQIAGGKLLAMAFFLLCALAVSAINPAMLFFFTEPEIGPILTGYLGLFLLALSVASLGLFLSSLTENQIVSAVFSFTALLILWLISWVEEAVPGFLAPVVSGISLLDNFDSFVKGVLDFQDALFYLTFTAAFFWLTVLSLENQRWRA